MFERLYPVSDKRSTDEIYGILAAARRTEGTGNVVLGAPPFKRDWLNRITAVRLRFEQADGEGASKCGAMTPDPLAPARPEYRADR